MTARTWTRLWSISVTVLGPSCALTAWLERRAWTAALSEHARATLRYCSSDACFGDGVCSCGYEPDSEEDPS